MTFEKLYEELSHITALRENRLKYAHLVLADMTLFPKLIDILFMVDDKVSCRAARVFEFVCTDYIYALIPHLDNFTENLHRVHLDSAVRPVAKVCEFLAKANYSKENHTIKNALQPIQKDRIIEACFDWMINDGKIAPKAYAMNTLFLFGKDYNWVHPELVQILKHDYHAQSAGFKARARHILKKLKAS